MSAKHSLYCLSASTMIGKLNGFSDAEILELRTGNDCFDAKLNLLVQLIKNSLEQRGAVDSVLLQNFFEQGYSRESLIDALYVVGDNFITHFTDIVLDVPMDFPVVIEL